MALSASFTGRDALIVFFGIAWQIGFAPLGMYRLFETHLLGSRRRQKRRRAWARLGLGMMLANAAPIGLFLGLYLIVIPAKAGLAPIIAAAMASLSMFGVRRLVHAFAVAHRHWSWFYDDGERRKLLDDWNRHGDASEAERFRNHFLPGLGFILLIPLLSFVVARVG